MGLRSTNGDENTRKSRGAGCQPAADWQSASANWHQSAGPPARCFQRCCHDPARVAEGDEKWGPSMTPIPAESYVAIKSHTPLPAGIFRGCPSYSGIPIVFLM